MTVITPDDTARILLDGRPLARTERSTRIDDLIPGEHYLLVEGAGGKRAFEVVQLGQDRDTFKLTPEQRVIAPAADDTADRSAQSALLYRALGEYIDTDLILLAGTVGTDEVGVQLYEPRTGNFSRVETRPVQGGDLRGALQAATQNLEVYIEDGALRENFLELEAAALDINANPPLSRNLLDPEPFVMVVPETRGPPWFVWAGVSTVVAGGAAGAVLLLTRDPTEPADTGTVIVSLPD